ncbi:MAG: hypothetical protein IKG18_00070 [Atopobiaceae bacterium]|nr:hypothetical protein [Atopobiaceae bacterium]
MGERLNAYIARIDALLADQPPDTDWERITQEHLVQIGFFQHERLIHLLVTLAFALMELATAIVTILSPSIAPAALMALFLVLLVPYVVHYYHLENGTQRLYAQYDELQRLTAHER